VNVRGRGLVLITGCGHPEIELTLAAAEKVVDARSVIHRIQERGPGLIALSGHDSTQWTLDAFGHVFGDRYRTLRVGEEFVITTD